MDSGQEAALLERHARFTLNVQMFVRKAVLTYSWNCWVLHPAWVAAKAVPILKTDRQSLGCIEAWQKVETNNATQWLAISKTKKKYLCYTLPINAC